ncbi:MAG: hypothetical protein ABR861_14865 [Terriglobales bacterium]|jgi:flagellar motor switch protein FliM
MEKVLIDVMLGGEGKNSEITRDLTEIEEQVLEGIVRIMCRELQTSWQAISLGRTAAPVLVWGRGALARLP